MSFYTELAADAVELLQEFGTAVTITRTTPGTYNPATGAPASGTTTTYNGAYGVVLEYRQRDIDGTHIRAGDRRVYVSTGASVTPRTGDKITVAGSTLSVVNVRPLQPALIAVLFDVQARA